MADMHELAVRRSERHDVALRGQVSVATEHASLIRLSNAAGGREGWIEADIVDFSSLGVGILSSIFFPKRSKLLVRVSGPKGGVLLEASGVVQRIVMTDRRPMYLIGLAFDPLSDFGKQQLAALLGRLDGSAPSNEGGDAPHA